MRADLLWLAQAAVALGAGLAHASPSARANTGVACASIPEPTVPGAEIIAIGPVVRSEDPEDNWITGLDICNVNISLTHPGVGDKVDFEVWLPLRDWNDRFLGVGGGAWTAGYKGLRGLGIAVEEGFVAAVTDGGNLSDSNSILYGDKVLSPDGVVDLGLLTDFASRSLHELAVVGKAVTASFYGKPPKYSYWNGCSTGGRQGYMLAQRYPEDFQGILAVAPALYKPSLLAALNWGDVVARAQCHRPSDCILDEFRKASVLACDNLDGVADGVISNPNGCDFDPTTLVGTQVVCGDDETTVTVNEKDARVVAAFHEGPTSPRGTKLWEAFPWGVDYSSVFSPVDPEAAPGDALVISQLFQSWIKYFIQKDHNYDVSDLNSAEKLADVFAVSHGEYGGIMGTDQPDLSGFRNAGGKLLTWHGAADEVIMLNNTMRYRRAVEAVMGGAEETDEFYRVFVAPGVAHCSGGDGAYPAKDFDTLIEWVEKGRAPDELSAIMKTADGGEATRKLCLWPKVARFNGVGDPDDAGSYECAASFGLRR